MSDTETAAAPVKKKGGMMKWLMIGTGLVVLIGGGVGGGLYAANSGLIGGGAQAESADADTPRLVPKSEEVRAAAKEGEEGGEGKGKPTPKGQGGDKFASTYYQMEKEFTSNLRDSVHFVQVGVAISTPYDNRVIENLKTHELAVRSAILLALGETNEDEVFTADGKTKLQKRLSAAINAVLKEKEGFGGIANVYFTNFIVQ
ncbi:MULTISPECIES: flagellar basal body-associated protein FliL [unclassified Sphingomonas]|uniref:flagellar basal body-associated FliL family protein n=1 Tax=unclassified Sphingomonas TaxID=196159 RepID=UPI002150AE79|nr:MULTISPECIES: flagellar basal body-associated FliL family protein [unclassified Sphingomonas]MCR5870522.1 flagellar basal body-associated FliL family protein [Sphingomonas sp. J344]UUY01133.1 flagellar basal body-associated FliL family protein [Sphingomonas sp. J315]